MTSARWVTCKQCGKRAYLTQRDAEKALHGCQHRVQQLRRARVSPILRAERRIYECEWTGYWHLTSHRPLDR